MNRLTLFVAICCSVALFSALNIFEGGANEDALLREATATLPVPTAPLLSASESKPQGQARVRGVRGESGAAYSLQAGSSVEHSFMVKITQAMGAADDLSGVESAFKFAGVSVTDVLAAEDDEVILGLRWRDPMVELQVSGTITGEEQSERLRAALERGLFLRKGRDGRLRSISFSEGCEASDRLILRALLAAVRVIVPEGSEDTRRWVTLEEDVDGIFEAEYQRAPGSKGLESLTKAFLTRVESGDGEEVDRSERGDGVASFQRGWLERMEWMRETRLRVESTGLLIRGELSANIQEVGRGRCEVEGFEALSARLSWFDVSVEEDLDVAAAALKESLLCQKIEGVSVDDLLNEIASLIDADMMQSQAMFDARDKLALLLERDPAALARLAELIRSGRLTDDVFDVAVGSLGQAGTPLAQSLLCELVSAPGESSRRRLSTAFSMFQIKRPTADSIEAVRFLALSGQEGPELSNTSLLLLGSFGGTPEGRAIQFELASLGDACAEDGRTRTWLEAIGNLGDRAPFEAALPYLQSPDLYLRVGAVNALRGSGAPEALEGLMSAASSDTAVQVRRAAVEVLAGKTDSASLEVIASVLNSDPSVNVRKAAVLGLHDRKDDEPAAMALLEQVAGQDPDPNLAALAQQMITGAEPQEG